jgi:hypothetical protein
MKPMRSMRSMRGAGRGARADQGREPRRVEDRVYPRMRARVEGVVLVENALEHQDRVMPSNSGITIVLLWEVPAVVHGGIHQPSAP